MTNLFTPMKLLTLLDYSAEVLHLCYILSIALFRFTVKAAVFTYVAWEYGSKYYHRLYDWLSPQIRRVYTTTPIHNVSL